MRYPVRLFYFYLLDYITSRTLILENQKKKKITSLGKCNQYVTKIVPNVVFIKQ